MIITIHDVAKEAGVSIATVSRVINNNYPVKEETREKIEKTIEKLGYVPNEIARSLILKSTSSIGIVVPGITNLFFPTIVEEINRVLIDKGFTMSLYSTEGDPNMEKIVIDSIISRNMDGIIAIDPSIENLENNYFQDLCRKIPTIIINGNTNKYECNFISYDEEAGTRRAFQYLLELGHRKISFIRGDRSLSYDLKENLYREFIRDNELDYENIISVGMGNSLEVIEKTGEIYEELLNSKDMGTAVFACNDLMAVGVINACNRAKIRVPEDMSVIGFDNTLLSSITHPRITTVDLKMKKIGKTAATELVDMIKGKYTKIRKIVYDTKLVVRESCSEIKEVGE
ncbi:MAG: LacI family DNA-binding transcriptional regulator [Tissierellaceae bacterium]